MADSRMSSPYQFLPELQEGGCHKSANCLEPSVNPAGFVGITISCPSHSHKADFGFNRSLSTPPNQIITPSIQETELQPEKSCAIDHKSTFSISQHHWRCEILERRINDGDDEVHIHPAMAVQLESEKSAIDPSQEEIELFNDYKNIEENKAVPIFWPKRVWDSSFLTPQETDRLCTRIKAATKKANIYELNQIHESKSQPRISGALQKSKEKAHKIRKPKPVTTRVRYIVEFSMLDYSTDMSDSCTACSDG